MTFKDLCLVCSDEIVQTIFGWTHLIRVSNHPAVPKNGKALKSFESRPLNGEEIFKRVVGRSAP